MLLCALCRSSHPRPLHRTRHGCTVGVLQRHTPVCHDVQGAIVTERQLYACVVLASSCRCTRRDVDVFVRFSQHPSSTWLPLRAGRPRRNRAPHVASLVHSSSCGPLWPQEVAWRGRAWTLSRNRSRWRLQWATCLWCSCLMSWERSWWFPRRRTGSGISWDIVFDPWCKCPKLLESVNVGRVRMRSVVDVWAVSSINLKHLSLHLSIIVLKWVEPLHHWLNDLSKLCFHLQLLAVQMSDFSSSKPQRASTREIVHFAWTLNAPVPAILKPYHPSGCSSASSLNMHLQNFTTFSALSWYSLSFSQSTFKKMCTSYNRGSRGTAKSTPFSLLVGQVQLCACADASVWWESYPVTRSPSCGRLHRQTVKPLPPPPVSSLLPRVLDFAIWDEMAVIFSEHKAARRPAKKTNRETQKVVAVSYGRTIQWAVRSGRPDPVLGSFWQVRTHAMMWNRDHLGELHHVIVWAIICNNKSTTNKK